MLEKADELIELIIKQHLEKLSAEEMQELINLVESTPASRKVYNDLSKPGAIEDYSKGYANYIEYFEPKEKRSNVAKTGKLFRTKFFWRISAAASVFLFLAIGAYIWFGNTRKPESSVSQVPTEQQTDLLPGQNKAVLTLADGRKVILDSAISNMTQGATTITNKDGHIVYDGSVASGTEVLYNTLATAKAEIYSMLLSDGSRVWLNSSSSIRYPVAFKGEERKVIITGEAYFEVTPDKSKPFTVQVLREQGSGVDIQVLGTSFNVNSYSDEEDIKTTLLEGLVKIKAAKGSVAFLKPGQQAQVTNEKINVIADANLQQSIAWKNGYFQFYRDDLKTVMRQIARWYDVEVVYEGSIQKREFGGKIHRTTPASEVLKILEKNNVHFRIEGKKIIVTP